MTIDFFPLLLASFFVGGASGYLGSLMLSRKMTVVVDPLSHLALPGVALALILNKEIAIGAFFFLFFGTLLIWFLEERTKLPTETIIAILFSISLAITFLFLEEEKIEKALIGDISQIQNRESIIIVLISVLIFLLVRKIYKKIILISISEDLAQGEKINLKKFQFLYLISISLIVALGVKFVGGLLISGLTALPSASAKNLSRNLKTYKISSTLIGAISGLSGILIFKLTNFPAGPLIVICSFFIFLISILLKNLFKSS